MCMKEYGLEGFTKIGQSCGGYVVATFWNEQTDEVKTKCVRDYDYADCSRDIDELYYMPIDEEARKRRGHALGMVYAGDTIQVIKGRKVPIGTVAKIVRIMEVKDKFGRWVANYALLDNCMRTNVKNCKCIG